MKSVQSAFLHKKINKKYTIKTNSFMFIGLIWALQWGSNPPNRFTFNLPDRPYHRNWAGQMTVKIWLRLVPAVLESNGGDTFILDKFIKVQKIFSFIRATLKTYMCNCKSTTPKARFKIPFGEKRGPIFERKGN